MCTIIILFSGTDTNSIETYDWVTVGKQMYDNETLLKVDNKTEGLGNCPWGCGTLLTYDMIEQPSQVEIDKRAYSDDNSCPRTRQIN